MCAYGECTPEHKALTNHLMACDSCFAPSRSYCSEGSSLCIDSGAAFIVSLDDLNDRRRWMDVLRREWADRMPQVELLVREKFEAKRTALAPAS